MVNNLHCLSKVVGEDRYLKLFSDHFTNTILHTPSRMPINIYKDKTNNKYINIMMFSIVSWWPKIRVNIFNALVSLKKLKHSSTNAFLSIANNAQLSCKIWRLKGSKNRRSYPFSLLWGIMYIYLRIFLVS